MLGMFRKKTEADKLHKKYERLLKEAYDLSTVNRKESDSKYAEADRILSEIEALDNKS